MKKYLQKKLNNEKGMTLIELLAVIVIIAIIAAIAIPAIGNIIENSRVGAIKSDAQNALAAANIYYTDNATAPSPVTVEKLQQENYLQDTGSLNITGTSIAKVSGGNTITGSGTDGGVKVDFLASTNADVSDTPNSSGDADGETTDTVTVTR